MSARTWTRQALKTALPATWEIRADPREQDQVSRQTVVVWAEDGERVNGGHAIDWKLSAYVLVPDTNPAAREDALEDALEQVIEAIEAVPELAWSTLERTVFMDRFHAYQIHLAVRFR